MIMFPGVSTILRNYSLLTADCVDVEGTINNVMKHLYSAGSKSEAFSTGVNARARKQEIANGSLWHCGDVRASIVQAVRLGKRAPGLRFNTRAGKNLR